MSPLRTLALLFVAATVFAVAVPAAGSRPNPQLIRLLWVQTSSHPTGNGASWTSRLRNQVPQFGMPAGTKVGAEVGLSRGNQYVGGIKLPGGVLSYSGKVKHLPRHAGIVVPVVAGTGTFTGATGTYTLYDDGDKAHPADKVLVLSLQYG